MKKNVFKKFISEHIVVGSLVFSVLITSSFIGSERILPPVFAEEIEVVTEPETTPEYERFAGKTRYETAVEISRKNWTEAGSVVLARGNDFPDALAGAVLANSANVSGPLLLTETYYLRPEVLQEIKRLQAKTVYLLGGTGAISESVERQLQANQLEVKRLEGKDRFATAANIGTYAVETSAKAFLASGSTFADALSISSYAAANGIPLLLTKTHAVPEATHHALQSLGVKEITLVGGEGVISGSVQNSLEQAGYTVNRLSGKDRYQTNAAILENLDFHKDQIMIATGTSFPDALAGSVLAAKNRNPIVLVPQEVSRITNTSTASYLDQYRDLVNKFFILGGSGAVNYRIEDYITTGEYKEKISLQFWDGYGVKSVYERQLSYVPGNLTDYIHILVPNFHGELQADGSFGYSFPSVDTPKYLVSLGKSKGAKVVPMILADGKIADSMLLDPAKRMAFADSAVKMVMETNSDGILIDLENLHESTQHGLTALMKDIYQRLNPEGKMVMVSVMSKTSRTAQPWYDEYNYRDLAQYADYIQIMTYDYHWGTSKPGPIAPLDWMRDVMEYAVTEIPSEKILMGVPYYGRAWRQSGSGWVSTAFGWAVATETAARYGATITRETTPTDPIGVPTFRYVDANGYNRIVYYDDALSWGAKLNLMDEFRLGGVGSWAMSWINQVSSSELYPVLKTKI